MKTPSNTDPEFPESASSKEQQSNQPQKSRRKPWRPIAIFLFVILVALIFHTCQKENPPVSSSLPPVPKSELSHTAPIDTPSTNPIPPRDSLPKISTTAPKTPPQKKPAPLTLPIPAPTPPRTLAPVDSGPYLYADPWGGRHFDSVRVSLHCRENCLILYSLEDSVHFKSYETPFVFRRNTTVWISGIDSVNRQVTPIRVDYVIERNPGTCTGNSMPLDVKGQVNKTVCMDIYEWPNREGEFPQTFVTQKEATDSCKQAGKRLCTQTEWHDACQGPDAATYPYGNKYNENYCPAKETKAERAGRFPVCRSYYGLYDMTGNIWEWTSTTSPNDADFDMVVGGNWNAGNEATCSLAKFSF